MAGKKLSFEEVLKQVTDYADDLQQNEKTKDFQGPEEAMEIEAHDFEVTGQDKFDQTSIKSNTCQDNLCTSSAAYASTIRRVLETRISCSSILHSESRLWLIMVRRRLSGRLKIRNPFNGECKRDIPSAIFKALQSALEWSSLEEFNEPNCYISGNNKGAVISFTTLKSVTTLFTIISGYNEMEVNKYFSRTLKSSVKTELIVNEIKDFALIYRYSKGQFIISFNFGLWNANGFPQHT